MFRVTTLDLKDIEFKSKRLTDRSEIYYHRLLTHIEDNNISDLLSDINGLLSSNNKISEKINFRDIIVATESKITRLKKDKNLRKLDPLFEKLYKKLVETNFFDRKESKKSKKIETYIPKWITSELLKEGTTLRLVNGYADTNKKVNVFTFSFFNLSITKRVIKSISDRVVDFSNDFFGKETNLTVSGQLEGELGAMALSKIYTFGPTFRAENSNTSRHLAEFWMIEPEVAFNDLVDNMDLAEDFLQYLVQYALEKCGDDLQFLDARFAEEEKQKPTQDRSELGLIDKLKFVVENKFQRLTYTEAIEVLKNAKKKFQFPVDWGTDLQSEHERYLVEKHFKKPVILTDYPEHIKAFYMKLSEDGKTVRAMDVLFPGIGEIIGGSQREEDYEKLKKRAHQFGIEEESVWWYLETRQFGTC
ncbi:MAG: hypothetical protein IT271_06840, partial [Chitinophagales bacterium]|nr:hypothetical protein [Chitinophagales bacterium]